MKKLFFTALISVGLIAGCGGGSGSGDGGSGDSGRDGDAKGHQVEATYSLPHMANPTRRSAMLTR
ncbi:hypothetical protein ST37_10495 [Vibrio sp. qd031]|uniref:hypothetical protein n=1 Tax=Vibrio sp. qd031 TaxID=1603038 RepID=UPI000A11AEC5|nr:hypothetical protein [Vibrio sp. qd031]ORT50301.1 hypothetical protein ST37_10495 [Vibrio sp. qd031]